MKNELLGHGLTALIWNCSSMDWRSSLWELCGDVTKSSALRWTLLLISRLIPDLLLLIAEVLGVLLAFLKMRLRFKVVTPSSLADTFFELCSPFVIGTQLYISSDDRGCEHKLLVHEIVYPQAPNIDLVIWFSVRQHFAITFAKGKRTSTLASSRVKTFSMQFSPFLARSYANSSHVPLRSWSGCASPRRLPSLITLSISLVS